MMQTIKDTIARSSTFDLCVLGALTFMQPVAALCWFAFLMVGNHADSAIKRGGEDTALQNHTLRRCRQVARITMEDMENPAREPVFMEDWRIYNRMMHYISQLK